MKHMKLTLLAASVAGLAMVTPAQASYTIKCDGLIKAWKTCMKASGSCQAETEAIETQCKCHRLKGGEWKLIMSAVAKDNVCGKDWPPDPPPDPSPPPRTPPSGHQDDGRGH